jgi:SAM-dependent methyltransferase
MFAGFGRLANRLASVGIDIETIELSPDFSSLIQIPQTKRHVGDVTNLVLPRKFERIFAAYNSFCLLTEDQQLQSLFKNIESMLAVGGLVSLSYYHPDFWGDSVALDLVIDGTKVRYEPSFDLSERKLKKAIWRDKYTFGNEVVLHEYPVRIFDRDEDLIPFLKANNLRIVDKVVDFNTANVSEPGWVDYVISF